MVEHPICNRTVVSSTLTTGLHKKTLCFNMKHKVFYLFYNNNFSLLTAGKEFTHTLVSRVLQLFGRIDLYHLPFFQEDNTVS